MLHDKASLRERVRTRQAYLRSVRNTTTNAIGKIAEAITSTPRQVTLRDPRPLYVDSSEVWLAGKLQKPNTPVTRCWDDLRADIISNCPLPADRVAIRKNLLGVSGVIDCCGVYVNFVWDVTSKGLVLSLPVTNDEGSRVFDELTAREIKYTLYLQNTKTTTVYDASTIPDGFTPLNLSKGGGDKHHTGYYRTDPRTGKREFIKPLGYTPQKPTFVKRPVKPVTTSLTDKGLSAFDDDDDVGIDAYKYCRKQKPKTIDDVKRIIREYVANEFNTSNAGVAAKLSADLAQHVLNYGYTTKNTTTESASDDSDTEVDTVGWSERTAKATPRLPSAYVAKGILLGINGKATRVSSDVEHAAYTYTKRFIVKGGVMYNHDKFVKGFEQSLAKMLGVKEASFDYSGFVKAISKEDNVDKKKSKKEVETPETHPHLYVDEDGVPTRLLSATLPMGSFYTGKGRNYGAWVPPVRESDITLNLSRKPSGWTGKQTTQKDQDWYMSWEHPVTGKKGYAYLSRKEADIHKFYTAAFLGSRIQKIMDDVDADIKGKNAKQAATALCVFLIDRLHIRNGNETFAKLKEGTFGVASLLKKHVKIDGTKVTFSFVGKKQEEWVRVLDFAGMPKALELLRKQSSGAGNDKLWETSTWRVTSSDVNAYLSKYDDDKEGMRVTAKTFRTFHANRYMHELLTKLEEIKDKYRLTDKDIRKVYKGVKSSDSLVNRKVNGVSLKDALGLTPYKKARGAITYGVLPTVAARLGHTTGACRSNYIDPTMVTQFAVKHGWDERTPKEVRGRDDLVVLEKSFNDVTFDVTLDILEDLDAGV